MFYTAKSAIHTAKYYSVIRCCYIFHANRFAIVINANI